MNKPIALIGLAGRRDELPQQTALAPACRCPGPIAAYPAQPSRAVVLPVLMEGRA